MPVLDTQQPVAPRLPAIERAVLVCSGNRYEQVHIENGLEGTYHIIALWFDSGIGRLTSRRVTVPRTASPADMAAKLESAYAGTAEPEPERPRRRRR